MRVKLLFQLVAGFLIWTGPLLAVEVAENPVFPRPVIVPVPEMTSGVAQTSMLLHDNWLTLANPADDFWAVATGTAAWTPFQIGGRRGFGGAGGRPAGGFGGGGGNGGGRPAGGFAGGGGGNAAYRNSFVVPSDFAGHRIVLRFDAVSNEAKVWVNGKYVRDHWGSFMPFTCDVTDFVTPGGTNTVVVGVDNSRTGLNQFVRAGGLQRDATIFAEPANYLTRFQIDTDLDGKYRNATLKVWLRMDFHGDARDATSQVRISLKDAKGNAVPLTPDTVNLSQARPETIAEIPVANPLKWDAEHPNLYTLDAEVLGADGTVSQRLSRPFGFIKTERVGNRFLVNGLEVKLRGLWGGNSAEFMVDNNINHTRQKWATDQLLDDCDKLGVYVTDENPVDFAKGPVTNDPKFASQYLSFIADLIERDRSHSSVIIWGLGNESDFGTNVEAAFRYVRVEDPRRMAQFSWASHVPVDQELPYDAYSFHYPPFDGNLASYGNSAFNSASLVLKRSPLPNIPVIADEYAHLPIYDGDELRRDPNVHNFWGESIKYYWEKIFATPGTLGGDIFGEPGNSGGRGGGPPPEIWLTKKAYSPVRVDNQVLNNPGSGKPLRIAVKNWFDHTNLSELKVLWSAGTNSGEMAGPAVAPHANGHLVIPARGWRDGDVVDLKFERSDGLVIDESALPVSPEVPTLPQAQGPAPVVSDTTDAVTVTGTDFTIVFSRQTGLITRGTYHGTDIIIDGPALHVVATDRGKSTVQLPAWTLKTITATQGKREAVVRISGAYGDVGVDFDIRIDGAGLITTTYSLGNFPFTAPARHPNPWNDSHYGGFSEIGVSFLLTDTVVRLSWNRKSLWTYYPADHIGRPSGIAQRAVATGTNVSWGGLARSGLGGYGGGAQAGGAGAVANDFRAMKENIYDAAALVGGTNLGLQAVSAAHDAVRLEVVGGGVNMIINNEWNYPQLGNSNYMKPPINVPAGYTNTVRARFINPS
jgi:hypothetical protein